MVNHLVLVGIVAEKGTSPRIVLVYRKELQVVLIRGRRKTKLVVHPAVLLIPLSHPRKMESGPLLIQLTYLTMMLASPIPSLLIVMVPPRVFLTSHGIIFPVTFPRPACPMMPIYGRICLLYKRL